MAQLRITFLFFLATLASCKPAGVNDAELARDEREKIVLVENDYFSESGKGMVRVSKLSGEMNYGYTFNALKKVGPQCPQVRIDETDTKRVLVASEGDDKTCIPAGKYVSFRKLSAVLFSNMTRRAHVYNDGKLVNELFCNGVLDAKGENTTFPCTQSSDKSVEFTLVFKGNTISSNSLLIDGQTYSLKCTKPIGDFGASAVCTK